MNFDSRIQIGDITIVKIFDTKNFLASLFFPKTLLRWPSGRHPYWPSIHNGIIGKRGDIEGIFETKITDNFHFTPWSYAKDLVDRGKIEVKIVRRQSLSENARLAINSYLNSRKDLKTVIKYDIVGMMSLIFNSTFRKDLLKFQSPEKWFCTELVRDVYSQVGINILGNEYPKPYVIEKKVNQGDLVEIADYYVKNKV